MPEFDGLHKSFLDNHVLEGVRFAVPAGAMFGFCGLAGKTTTMRNAMGLVRPDAGEVRCRSARRRATWRSGGSRSPSSSC